MTKPSDPARNRPTTFIARHGPIAAILLLASWLRLDGIGFGLPALNDPDEPLFMMQAFDMLRRGSFNPQWFGHPGTITLYCLAAIMVAVAFVGTLTGRFANLDAFAQAVYHDPAIVFLPGRVFIAFNGVLCVWLVYVLGRRLWGRNCGLAAALVLAVNAVHIAWSQVIRTDVQASMFMLLCIERTLAFHRTGRLRDLVAAAMLAGIATATKWPAAVIALAPVCAAIDRAVAYGEPRRRIALPLLVAAMTLVAVSPFLLIDHAAVLRDLAGESRTTHPGATGSGLIGNLAWYARTVLAPSFGWAGLVMAVAGTCIAARQQRSWAVCICPVLAAFVIVVSAQHLVWERWLVPAIPLLALGFAGGLNVVAGLARRSAHAALVRWLQVTVVALLIVPMIDAARTRAAERRLDTRQIASAWVQRNVPAGSTILVEHAAFDLLQGPWRLVFPLGSQGCVDARAILGGAMTPKQIEKHRSRAIVLDVGHVSAAKLGSCRADFAVLSGFDRYRDSQSQFPAGYASYLRLLAKSRPLNVIAPERGKRGGPRMTIFAMEGQAANAAKQVPPGTAFTPDRPSGDQREPGLDERMPQARSDR